MRLPLKTLIACTGAAATMAIAGCGPATTNGAAASDAAVAAASTPAAVAPEGTAVAQQTPSGAGTQPASSGTVSFSAETPQPTVTTSSPAVTTLSIGRTLAVPHPYQRTALVAGHLAEPADGGQSLAGRVVWLERLGAGDWVLFRAHVTGPGGNVVFRVHVVVGAEFRLVFPGAPGLARAVSAVRIVP
jgi:hypothetical protein